ncbi:adenylate kinase-domain-containing protein [Lipomyces kononenkoae]|uniref:Adenylate kinase-domain-containing protein n=1 Tax=Lipomyces kononenkoae TaxID=34357 RepID=A0ACC3T8W0_LIPKO
MASLRCTPLLRTGTAASVCRLRSSLLLLPASPQPRAFAVQTVRSYSAGNSSSNDPSKKPPNVFALLGIILAGSGVFYLLSKSMQKEREVRRDMKLGDSEIPTEIREKQAAATTVVPVPAFSKDEVKVIFVLGGPGVGKGTQCANLVRDYDFVHLSAGDLLRAEQAREGSEYGELISTYIREGKIVPQEITIALLRNAMQDAVKEGHSKFLIDGFPRKMDQAIKFEEDVAVSEFTLYFDCSEDVMLQRLLKRGETSGRSDDNIESIKKRFKTFVDTSMPVIDYYRGQNKVISVPCEKTKEEVYDLLKEKISDRMSL